MAKRDFTGVFIPAVIWESTSLIPAEKMLLGEIIALSEREGYCYASRSHFAEWLNCTAQNVTYFLNKLERLGFLNIDRTPGFRSKISVNKHVFYGTGKPDLPVSPIDGGGKPDLRVGVNGVDGGGKWGLPEIKDKSNNEIKDKSNLPANAAEPEKENPTFTLKAKKEKGNTPAPGAARPKKEAPLLQWQETITCFEDIHRQHFTAAGIWIGFDWSGKELKGLKELRGKMAKDIEAKNGYEPDANQINAALSRFFSEALKDDFTKNNWFTPAMLNNRYQEIKQKIYAHANGTTAAKQRSKTVQEQQHDLLATVIANRRY